jgi:glycosyltransferase involved in cell wall biosynthesis
VLQAADRLRRERGIRFVLLGDGKEKPALLERAGGMGLDNIHFAPPVPKAQMPTWLADADAGLAILRGIEAYKTTYPNKVFDYMAAGKPVILAIDGVIRRVVETAHAGIYVQPGDPAALSKAVLQLAEGREQARSMGQAGRAYVRDRFNRPDLAVKMMGVMESLARPRTGDPEG